MRVRRSKKTRVFCSLKQHYYLTLSVLVHPPWFLRLCLALCFVIKSISYPLHPPSSSSSSSALAGKESVSRNIIRDLKAYNTSCHNRHTSHPDPTPIHVPEEASGPNQRFNTFTRQCIPEAAQLQKPTSHSMKQPIINNDR